MLKTYVLTATIVFAHLVSSASDALVVDTNNILLKFTGQKITYSGSITSDGVQHTDKDDLIFEYSKLTLKIDGLPDDKRAKLKIYKRKPGQTERDGDIKSELEITTSEKVNLKSTIDNIAEEDKVNGLLLMIVFDGDIPLKFTIKDAATIIEKNVPHTSKVCANPVFYRSAQLGMIDNNTTTKPYYIIEYNYNTVGESPNIFLIKTTKKQRIAKSHVVVGRNATVVFKNFKPNYDKITLTKSFFDFHLEGQKTFSDLISGTKAGSSEATGNVSKGATATVSAGQKENNEAFFISTLARELELFWEDVNRKEPRSEKVTTVLDQVKASIKSCIGIPELVTPASLETFIKSNFRTVNDSELNRATSALQNLENYSLYATNSFQIKNMDELRLNVAYVKNNLAVDVDTDPFVIPILGGLKLDISTGFLFSNLSDRKYFIADAPSIIRQETLPDGTVQDQTIAMKRVVEETNSKYKIGLGILSHFYPRLSKWFSVGFTSGFILKDNLAVQFPIGGSLMLGRASRIVLSGGKVFGEANRLSDRYTLSNDVEESTLTNVNSDNLVTKKFKSGWFFALTYNFGGTTIGH